MFNLARGPGFAFAWKDLKCIYVVVVVVVVIIMIVIIIIMFLLHYCEKIKGLSRKRDDGIFSFNTPSVCNKQLIRNSLFFYFPFSFSLIIRNINLS